jgi:hypothetical protein
VIAGLNDMMSPAFGPPFSSIAATTDTTFPVVPLPPEINRPHKLK